MTQTHSALQRIAQTQPSPWNTYSHVLKMQHLIEQVATKIGHVQQLQISRHAHHFMSCLKEEHLRPNENSKRQMLRINSGTHHREEEYDSKGK